MLLACEIFWLGEVGYQEAWDLQKFLAAEIHQGNRLPALLLLTHPHTYTFGRRGDLDNLLLDQVALDDKEIAVHWVDRGGDVTYHGPGQLVGYPILPLAPGGLRTNSVGKSRIPQADYVGYLRKLEKTIILALEFTGIRAFQIEGLTGVWVESPRELDEISNNDISESEKLYISRFAKIASIGVKIDANGISQHGFALNISTDPAYWEGIVACGLVDYRNISLHEILNPVPSMDKVVGAVSKAFGHVFDTRVDMMPETKLTVM